MKRASPHCSFPVPFWHSPALPSSEVRLRHSPSQGAYRYSAWHRYRYALLGIGVLWDTKVIASDTGDIPIVKICTQSHAWVHCIKLWYASQNVPSLNAAFTRLTLLKNQTYFASTEWANPSCFPGNALIICFFQSLRSFERISSNSFPAYITFAKLIFPRRY